MKPRRLFSAARLSFPLASALAAMLATPSANAAIYYWDSNDGNAGFGTASGTWAAPTSGTATAGWSTDATGATVVNGNSVTTLNTNSTTDAVNFGTLTAGLGAGTINVGTVSSGDITFGLSSGPIVLSGGTITLTAAQTTTVNNATNTINSILAGAATSLTKAGTGILTLSAANTYGGATVVAGGTLKLGGPSLFTENFNNGGLAQTGADTQETTGLKLGHGKSLSGWTKAGDGTIHSVDRTGSNDWAVMFYGGHTAAGVNTITSSSITSANTLNQTYHVTFDLSAANYQQVGQRNNGTTDGVTVIALDSLGNTIATQNFIPGSFASLASAGNLPFTTVTLNYVGTGTGTGVASFKFQATSPTSTGRFGGSIDNLFVTSAATNLLPTSTALSVASGSTFDLAGNNQTVASLADSGGGGGIVTSSAGSSTLTLNPSSGSTTFSGVISSQISLIKSGAGTQVLSGSNTYLGATNVNAGKLIVNGSISTSILTTIASGATIGGIGTVGALTVLGGGFHTPGNSPGIQNTGNYSNAGTLGIEINGATVGTDYDQVNTTGSVSLTGLLSITMGYTPAVNALFFILANDLSDPITGTFSNAPVDGSTYTLGGQQFQISYFGNQTSPGVGTFTGGNDVVLMAIPEPNVAALLGGLGTLLLLRRRR